MKKADVGGKIVGIEYITPLLAESMANVKKNHNDLLEQKWLHLMHGDGWNPSNIPDEFGGPYDAIHVGAAASTLPKALLSLLKNGGVMVIPIGPQHQTQFFVSLVVYFYLAIL